jgi:hypothetical protein
VPQAAVEVAYVGQAQADVLHFADGLAEVHRVADAVLVLEHDEQAGQVVGDQALRAEADGQTDDSGAGQQRAQRDAHLVEDHGHAEHEQDDRHGAAEHGADGAGPLLAALFRTGPVAGQHGGTATGQPRRAPLRLALRRVVQDVLHDARDGLLRRHADHQQDDHDESDTQRYPDQRRGVVLHPPRPRGSQLRIRGQADMWGRVHHRPKCSVPRRVKP